MALKTHFVFSRPVILLLHFAVLVVSCQQHSDTKQSTETNDTSEHVTNHTDEPSPTLYESDKLVVEKVAEGVYRHVSYLEVEGYGMFPCNGMIVCNEGEAAVFDTPTDNNSAAELIEFITHELQCTIKAVVPTHFHVDCVGGLSAFEQAKVPVLASQKTIDLLLKKDSAYAVPIKPFDGKLSMRIGTKDIGIDYFGEGHTIDNLVVYCQEQKVLFGGCLLKSHGAGKGNLNDANTAAWSETVRKVKDQYAEAETVIPGHGNIGDRSLLEYTIQLFEETSAE